jgi:urease subunit beta
VSAEEQRAPRPVRPGEVLVADGTVELFAGRPLSSIEVVNHADRPIQVGSHFHFAEANEGLEFDRAAALGCRLAVPAGTSVRFEPGVAMTVRLVPFGGDRFMAGFRGLHRGSV